MQVVVQTVGVAVATMPLAGGFVGIIPALKILQPPDGPANIATDPWVQLVWCLSLTYFGIFFAVPFVAATRTHLAVFFALTLRCKTRAAV